MPQKRIISTKQWKAKKKLKQQKPGQEKGKYKQWKIQKEGKKALAWKQRIFQIEQEIRKRGLKHEPFKPGRFAKYYVAGKIIPANFMSAEEELLIGGSPGGFLNQFEKYSGTKLGIDFKDPTQSTIPQIRLIPKEQLKSFMESRINLTLEEMKECDELPTLKDARIRVLRKDFATADWAEQTYGIQIDVDPKLLEWIGKVK
ncbi:MAG: hypothetical protein V1847_04470 [Candidatus Diapherotrites archaeon]